MSGSADLHVQVRFWGTRGSIATPGTQTQRYGGNTSCVEVSVDGSVFIFDAGTGIRELGVELLARTGGPVEAHLFASHTHWDHIQGFPFFTPAYKPTTKLYVYELARDEERVRRALLEQMRPGFFPVTTAALKGQIVPRYFEREQIQLNGIRVRYLEQKHPGRSFAYRLEHREQSVVYATDSELDLLLEEPAPTLKHPDALRRLPKHVENFVRDADLLIADTQYTDEEYEKKMGWGHSRVGTVVDLAVSASVRRLALFHHDPIHSDDKLEQIVETANSRARMHGSSLEVFAAREGATLIL